MNINRSALFWGVLLTAGGLLALADQMGFSDTFSPQVWSMILGAFGLLGLVSYALSGWKEWGWLFPAGLFGGLAAVVWLADAVPDSAAVAAPLFFGLLIPFIAAYLTDRSRNWWAVIPGGVMLFLGLTVLMVNSVNGEWVGALFLFLIALSFFVVYLNDRTRIWALILAYVMTVLSVAPMLAAGGETAAYFGPVFLFAVALPFFILYFRSVDNWWAIIPAGAVTITGIVAALAIAGLIRNENEGGIANAIILSGLAATFAVVWLRHARQWAKIATIILLVLAVGSVFFATYMQVVGPLLIIVAGIYLFFTALRPKIA
jgi:hypothetical protein